MAYVKGKAGRYVRHEAVKKRRQIIIVCILLMALVGTTAGFVAGFGLRQAISTWPTAALAFMLEAGVLWGVAKLAGRKMDRLEEERMAMRKGADGERAVALSLADFPDEFYVINDLQTPSGNIDHAVVGPTGVFLIDTKNWRGVVSADGSGELLCNGKPTEKPTIGPFVRRLMRVKGQVKSLSGLEPYYQGLLAFPSARVDARWGTTKNIHCLREDQLYDYIVERKRGQKLSSKEIDSLAQAFLALARMDRDFEPASQPSPAEEQARVQTQPGAGS